MRIYNPSKNKSKFAIFIVIARYSLISAVALPFLIIGLLFDVAKLPVLLLLMLPLWLIMDLAIWIRTGDLDITMRGEGDMFYMGVGIMLDTFYGTNVL